MSQPAVSKMIANLEQCLGTSLFIRHSGGLTLTDHGFRLSEAVSSGFLAMEAAVEEITRSAAREDRNVVVLSMSSALAALWVVPKLDAFHAIHPEIDLQFRLFNSEPAGLLGGADLGIRMMAPGDADCRAHTVAPEEIVPVCSPAYLAEHGSLDNPAGTHTLLQTTKPRVTWQQMADRIEGFDPATTRQLTFSDYSVLLQTAICGQGVALGWLNIVANCLRQGVLVPASRRRLKSGSFYSLYDHADAAQTRCVAVVKDWMISEMEADLEFCRRSFPGS